MHSRKWGISIWSCSALQLQTQVSTLLCQCVQSPFSPVFCQKTCIYSLKIRFCGVSESNEWVHEGQFFHKWKVNAELYRMGYIFDLFLCQWGYVMEFSTSPIGIYLECYLSAEVIWNFSRSQEWNSQYLDLKGNTSDSVGVVLPSESGLKCDAKLCWVARGPGFYLKYWNQLEPLWWFNMAWYNTGW